MAKTSPMLAPPRERLAAHTHRSTRVIGWLLRTAPLRSVRLWRADWLYIAGVFMLTRLLIVFLGLLGAALFPAVGAHQTFALQQIGGPGDWMRLFAHFDSGWYIGISHGYLLPSSGRADWLMEWAFFPLYPMALHPVAVALSVLHVPTNTDVLAGVIVSYAAFFGSLIYLYRLIAAELSLASARRGIFYVAIFPTAIFFSAVYPESLFLFMTVGAFYHARRRQWALAGLLTAGALLTRPQGLFLLAPLVLEFVAAWREGRGGAERRNGRLLKGLWLGLPLVALGGYALYSHAETGYWFAFSVSATQARGTGSRLRRIRSCASCWLRRSAAPFRTISARSTSPWR
ncbi:MAG: mannosyltransferase family protein [Ktedonobacterales bacterium]